MGVLVIYSHKLTFVLNTVVLMATAMAAKRRGYRRAPSKSAEH
jgi:hypothetical protein